MAQTYKMMLGTSGKQWELLTVREDGRMTMTFHGTDREISHEVTENADGWLCYPGAMFPGLESGRWQAVAAQMRNEELEMRNENEEMRNEVADIQGTVPAVGSEAESERTTEGLSPMCAEPAVPVESALRGQSPCNPPSATHTGDSPREPRPRRQRKARKAAATAYRGQTPCNPSSTSHTGDSPRESGNEWLRSAGYLVAATVALFVIYETGLLIPMGLIGLATSGLLK